MGRTAKKPVKKRITYGHVIWEGEKYRVAKVKKGTVLSLSDKLQLAKVICLMYKTDDYSLSKCCESVGLTVRTFYNWRVNISEVSEVYLEADREKEIVYTSKLRERGRTSAERLTDGFTVELEDYDLEAVFDEKNNPVLDKDGQPKMVKTRIRVRQQYIRPSVKMTETILYNTDVRVFEKNPKPVEKINQDVDIPLIDWVE